MSGLRAIARADAVLRALETHGTMSAADLAAALGSPVSSTYRLLRLLTSAGWVEPALRRGDYRLGPYILTIASKVEKQLDLRTLAHEPMAGLVEVTGLAITLLVERGDRAVCIERRVPPAANTLTPQIGDSVPLHAGAGPLLLLAHLPERARAAALAGCTEAERDLIPDDLDQRIATALSHRVMRSHDDLLGADTLAAPVRNHRGELVAALTLHRVHEGRGALGAAADALDDAAAALSRSIGEEGGA